MEEIFVWCTMYQISISNYSIDYKVSEVALSDCDNWWNFLWLVLMSFCKPSRQYEDTRGCVFCNILFQKMQKEELSLDF